MCLIVFSYKNHPKYDLILAANRDEAYERPTRAARFWEMYPDVLAGKDLSAGGTWLGINRSGSFAALTNYRDPTVSKNNPPSRGAIVLDHLVSRKPPEDTLIQLDEDSEKYMGFNLLIGTSEVLYCYSNHTQASRIVEPGVHGLSNHLLDTPWPKVEQAKAGLASAVKRDSVSPEVLFDLMQDDKPAPAKDLPDTGIPKDLEKNLSSLFIKTEKYGTRNTTVLLIENNGAVTFEERRYQPHTSVVEETSHFEFEAEV